MSCKYHDFRIVGEDEKMQAERCRLCGLFVSYRKVQGRIDNVKYLKDHVRDFCQSVGPTAKVFEEIYGKEAAKKSRALKMQNQDDEDPFEQGIEEVKEGLKLWGKMEAKGFTDAEIIRAIQDI